MAITIPSVDDVKARLLAVWRNRFPGRSLGDTSFIGKMTRAEAMTFYMFLQSVVAADNNSKPTDKTSLEALIEWAETIGLPNGNGGFGQKLATVATGLVGLVTGTKATIYTTGLELLGSDGATSFKLVSGVTIPGSAPGTGSIPGVFDALTGGTVGNLKANDVLTWSGAPSGSDNTVVLTGGPSTAGIDIESAADLLERIIDRFRSPPKGGTAADFRFWAESVSGVKRAYVFPLIDGIGSVRTVIVSPGSGRRRLSPEAVRVAAADYIETVRPCMMQGQTVRPAYMPLFGTGPDGKGGITIRIRLVPATPKYAFDWDDTATSYAVDTGGYTAPTDGNPATLRLSALAATSLKEAITAQLNPRIQILVSTVDAPAVPIQVRCTHWADGGGKTTLTFEDPLPKGFDNGAWVAPAAGDAVYAGGPMVTVIGAAILDYVDSLGPSRNSGYAAAGGFWEDTVAVARLGQIALDQEDTEGIAFASNILPGGVTIANGVNSPTTSDARAIDHPTYGAELLWAKWIAVTQ